MKDLSQFPYMCKNPKFSAIRKITEILRNQIRALRFGNIEGKENSEVWLTYKEISRLTGRSLYEVKKCC